MNKKLKIALGVFIAFIIILILIPSENKNSAKTESNAPVVSKVNPPKMENLLPEKQLMKEFLDKSYTYYRPKIIDLGNQIINIADNEGIYSYKLSKLCQQVFNLKKDYDNFTKEISKKAQELNVKDKFLKLKLSFIDNQCIGKTAQLMITSINAFCVNYDRNELSKEELQKVYNSSKNEFLKYIKENSNEFLNGCYEKLREV